MPSVAVVGCGRWGRNHVRNFTELGCLGATCDGNPATGATYSQFTQLLSRSDCPPAIVLATPARLHFSMAKQALLAGKDVLVEKPMALNLRDARELAAIADKRGRILMVGHVLEYHPAIRTLHELVRNGQLGALRYIYSSRLSLGRLRKEENVLWSFAPHDLAVVLRLAQDEPVSVAASGGDYVQPGIPDVTLTSLLFRNGTRAYVHVSWLHPFKEQRLVVVGADKMVVFDDVRKKLTLYDQRGEIDAQGEPVAVKGAASELSFGTEEPLRRECEAFLAAVQTREKPLTDCRSGLKVMELLDAAQRSLAVDGAPMGIDRG